MANMPQGQPGKKITARDIVWFTLSKNFAEVQELWAKHKDVAKVAEHFEIDTGETAKFIQRFNTYFAV